jgi:hypothetical protein
MATKAELKEVFYLKAPDGHYKVIEVYTSKRVEIMLTDKVERFLIVKSTLENYLSNYKLVFRKEITDYLSSKKLDYALPVVQLSLFMQGRIF